MMSPWLIQTFFRSFPRMCASRFVPSKQSASSRPFPSILTTCAYSGGSSVGCHRTSCADGGRLIFRVNSAATALFERTLTLLLECEFTLLIVVLVLSPSPVFTSLRTSSQLGAAPKRCGSGPSPEKGICGRTARKGDYTPFPCSLACSRRWTVVYVDVRLRCLSVSNVQ